MIPLCSSAVRALRCFFTMFTPFTVTRPFLRKTRMTSPRLPLSSPRTTITWSPRTTGIAIRSRLSACRFRLTARGRSVRRNLRIRISDDLWRQRHDLHVLPVAQLARDGAEDARRPRLALLVDDHDRVLVEADVAPVLSPRLLCRAHHHRAGDVGLLHRAIGQRVLHGDDHDVAETGVAPARAAQDADHQGALRARVVRDLHHRLLLDHGPLSLALARALNDLDHAPPLVL